MSDNKNPEPRFGEPVEEHKPTENVVDRANQALADAEAAREQVAAHADAPVAAPEAAAMPAATDAPVTPVESETPSFALPADDASAVVSGTTAAAATPDTQAAATPAAEDEPDWSALDAVMAEQAAKEAATVSASPVAEAASVESAHTVAAEKPAESTAWYDQPEVTESTSRLPESVQTVTELTPPAVREEDEVLTGAAAAQPIFVQAPEAPLVRGNRGAAGAIGLLASLVFALVYLASRLLVSNINLTDTTALLDETIRQISSFSFWTPVAVFFLAFWLLGAFINRAKWGIWVILSLLVGLAAFAGHAVGAVLQAGPWSISWDQAVEIMRTQILTVPAIVALVIGRELPIWFGAWVAARGRRITELNAQDQEEYERTLEAGPKLVA